MINIENSTKIGLHDFIDAIETANGCKAIRHCLEMQPGDMPATWADGSLLCALTGYAPPTDMRECVARFVD